MDAFFAEELGLLATLAAEAAVALENARLYEELTRSQEIIRRADRLSALGTLAAGIAHEIRNPLVSIQTFFQLAPDRLNDQEFLTEFLHLTSGEVKRITDLISDLLTFARSPTPSMADVDLNDLIAGVVRLLEPQLRKGPIAVIRDLAADLPPTRADRDQLKQVFLNILLNAIQAIDGEGRITISSREVMHKSQPYCQMQIGDSGGGLAVHRLGLASAVASPRRHSKPGRLAGATRGRDETRHGDAGTGAVGTAAALASLRGGAVVCSRACTVGRAALCTRSWRSCRSTRWARSSTAS